MRNYLRAAYYLAGMMRRAYWDRRKLADYRNRKVREIVRYAYENVPFYHRKFDQIGVRTAEIKTVEDLNTLPVLTKTEIQENLPKMISKEYDIQKLRPVSTSGSTGQPLSVCISNKEDEFRKAKHLRANMSCGQKARDRWVVITTPLRAKEVTRLQRILGMYVFTPVSVFDDVTRQISILEKLKPNVLDGYSSSLLLLAKEMERRGIHTIKPRFVIGGAEMISGSSRALVERVFNAPFYDQYACIELERMAWQCSEKKGYHIDADSLVMQFVDENGKEVAVGEQGEIVCTSLFNYAMPLIRYDVGDVGVASEEKRCTCGRTFPLLKLVEGRRDSFIILPDGRILSPQAFCWTMKSLNFYSQIDHYRIIQRKKDLFEFYIKMNQPSADEEAMRKELAAHFARAMNVSTQDVAFEVEFVEDIPLDKSGKLSTVVSELR
jgi:phenylacetate-CoA ligase